MDIKAALLELPKLLSFLKAKIYFTEIKTKDGKILFHDKTLAVDVELQVQGKDGMEAAPDGKYEFENGAYLVVKAGKITEMKESEKPNDGDPMAKCIAEQKEKGVECPECVCKELANMAKHLVESKMSATKEDAEKLIGDKFKSDPVFAYLFSKLSKPSDSSQAVLKAENDIMKKLMGFVKTETGKIETSQKEMFKIIETIANSSSVPTSQRKKDGFKIDHTNLEEKEIQEFKKRNNL